MGPRRWLGESLTSNKLHCLVLPTQKGKTFEVIKHIEKHDKILSVIYTQNSKLANTQFAGRLKSFENANGEGTVVIFNSSKKRHANDFKHVNNQDALLGYIRTRELEDLPRCKVIVMCNNSKRHQDGMKVVNMMSKKGHYNINLYFDEFHKYINPKLRNMIQKIYSNPGLKEIWAITATPKKSWWPTGHKMWNKFKIIDVDKILDPCYVMLKHHNYKLIEMSILNGQDYCPGHKYGSEPIRPLKDVEAYIDHVISENPEILSANKMVFAPAKRARETHRKVREIIWAHNKDAVVVTLNGENKTLEFINHDDIDQTELIPSVENEIPQLVNSILKDKNLTDRCVVYTGYELVSMGQTLTSEESGPFTDAIVSHSDVSDDDIYQLMGRTTGRMREWETFRQTTVYCPLKTRHRAIKRENQAIDMASNYGGKEATVHDYNKDHEKAKQKKPTIEAIVSRPFRSFEEAVIYGEVKGVIKKTKPRKPGPDRKNSDGLYWNQISKNRIVMSVEDVKIHKQSRSGMGKSSYAIRPCYLDLKDHTTERWILVHFPIESDSSNESENVIITNNEP